MARSTALMASDADAETYYQEAIKQLSGTAVRTELARAHLLYGEWLRRRKRRRDAQCSCGRPTTCSPRWEPPRSPTARVPSGAPPARRRGMRRSADNPFGLTPQETQVARQAGAGATNAEIASRLFITTSTVEYHLSKVFRKLGVTSRRQLATALSEGLEHRADQPPVDRAVTDWGFPGFVGDRAVLC